MKTFKQLSCVGALLAATMVPSQAVITVVDYYRLGEADPGAANGVSGNATTLDSGPAGGAGALTLNSTTATYSNSVASTASSTVGSTLSMDLNGAYYASSTVSITATENWGMEMWFKLDDSTNGSTQIFAYNGRGSTGTQNGFGLYVTSGGVLNYFYGGVMNQNTGVTIADNTWYYVAIVNDGAQNKYYVNSATANIASNSSNNAAATTGFAIGTEIASAGVKVAGNFDEVRTFTFAAGQFNASTDLLISVPEPGTVALFGLGLASVLSLRRRRAVL